MEINSSLSFNFNSFRKYPLIFFLFLSNEALSGGQTPSQALPEILNEPVKQNSFRFDKENQVLPNSDGLKFKQQPQAEIVIIAKTLFILAPEELQNKVDFSKYEKLIVGKPNKVANFYAIANEMTKEFKKLGFPLVRVIVPKQELQPDQATLFLKVIDGFIEKVDLSKVPKLQTLRTYAYLKPIIKKRAITESILERQLVLAGNSAGLTLKSGFAQGIQEGGAVLVIEAEHKLLSGGITFNNSQSEELGRQLGQAIITGNSSLGLGETFSFIGLARPTIKGMKGTGNSVTIRGGGMAINLPIGSKGVSTDVSYIESMTRPGGDLASLGIESNNKSASLSVSYPIVLRTNKSWVAKVGFDWSDEIQQTNLSGEDEQLSHDRLTSLRLGLNYTGCNSNGGCTSFDGQISRGLDIASRSASEVGLGTPLSRTSGTSTFNHAQINFSHNASVLENYSLRLSGGGQYTEDGLLNSEQSTIIGPEKVSAFTSGSISGDKTWYARCQLNKSVNLSNKLTFSPYLYSAMGVAYLNKATATENKQTAAKSIGVGLEFLGEDNYFFDKNITGKIEYSKNWATKKLEDLSDIRLNKQHLFVSLAMNF